MRCPRPDPSSCPRALHLAAALLIASVALALAPAPSAALATITGLGVPTGSASRSSAFGVSADGSTVVGYGGGTGTANANITQAYRWTASGGVVGLGWLPYSNYGDAFSSANAVSADGNTVIGFSAPCDTCDNEAFRWTASGGMVGLGGTNSYAAALTPDASVIVGNALDTVTTNNEAVMWTGGGTQGITPLGYISGGNASNATGVSADGSVVVGDSNTSTGLVEAFRWTAGGGMAGIGWLPGVPGPNPAVQQSDAYAVSADGSRVVGWSTSSKAAQQAFIWDPVHGMVPLANELKTHGADLSNWQLLIAATGISADGHTIVGYGRTTSGVEQAFVAYLPEPGSDALVLAGLLGLAVTRRRRG